MNYGQTEKTSPAGAGKTRYREETGGSGTRTCGRGVPEKGHLEERDYFSTIFSSAPAAVTNAAFAEAGAEETIAIRRTAAALLKAEQTIAGFASTLREGE